MRPEQIALCYGSIVAYLAEIYFAAPIRRPAPRAHAAQARPGLAQPRKPPRQHLARVGLDVAGWVRRDGDELEVIKPYKLTQAGEETDIM